MNRWLLFGCPRVCMCRVPVSEEIGLATLCAVREQEKPRLCVGHSVFGVLLWGRDVGVAVFAVFAVRAC